MLLRLLALIVRDSVIALCAVVHNVNNDMDEVLLTKVCTIRTTRININRNNINPNDYYNSLIDYYNPLLRFDPCLNQLGLILIRLILIPILDLVIVTAYATVAATM